MPSVHQLLYIDQLASDAADENRLRFVFRALPRTRAIKLHPDEHSLQARWVDRAELPPLLRIPIDHALTAGSVAVRRTIERDIKSDHLPFTLEIGSIPTK